MFHPLAAGGGVTTDSSFGIMPSDLLTSTMSLLGGSGNCRVLNGTKPSKSVLHFQCIAPPDRVLRTRGQKGHPQICARIDTNANDRPYFIDK
jgi:hypothetical protein